MTSMTDQTTFEAALQRARARAEQDTFTTVSELYGERFEFAWRAKPTAPAVELIGSFVKSSTTTDDVTAMLDACTGFLDAMATEDTQAKIAALYKAGVLDSQDLVKLMSLVVERTTGRPFGTPSPSPDISSTTGAPSTDGRTASTDLTQANSHSIGS